MFYECQTNFLCFLNYVNKFWTKNILELSQFYHAINHFMSNWWMTKSTLGCPLGKFFKCEKKREISKILVLSQKILLSHLKIRFPLLNGLFKKFPEPEETREVLVTFKLWLLLLIIDQLVDNLGNTNGDDETKMFRWNIVSPSKKSKKFPSQKLSSPTRKIFCFPASHIISEIFIPPLKLGVNWHYGH